MPVTLSPQIEALLADYAQRNGKTPDELVLQWLEQEPAPPTDSVFKSTLESRTEAILILKSVRNAKGELEDFEYVYANKRACQKIGKTNGDLIGQRLSKILTSQCMGDSLENYKQVVETGEPFQEDCYIPENQPNSGWWLHLAIPLLGQDGITISYRNITPRKTIELELRKTNQNYAELVESIPNLIYRVAQSPDGRIWFDYVSPRIREINGLEPEAVLANPSVLQNQIHPQDRAQHDLAMQESFEHSTPFFWVGRSIIQGEIRWLRLESYPRKQADGTVIWYGVQTDITAQMALQESLRKNQEDLNRLMESIPNAIYFKDTHSRFTRVNQPMLDLLHQKNAEDVLGKTDLDFHLPHLASAFLQEERELMTTGVPIVDRLEYNPTPDGQPRWISATKVALRNQKNEIVGMVGISHNITERKLAEQSRLELELERERVKILATFIQNSAHEFRTPLTIIHTSLHLLAASQSLDEKGSRYLEKIRSQADSIMSLVDNLIFMLSLDTQTTPLRPIHLANLWSTLLDGLSKKSPVKSHHISLITTIHDEDKIMGDAFNLNAGITHILDNALRYTPEGGQIDVVAHCEGQCFWLTIRDNGIGMTQETQQRAFERFYRADTAHTERGFGLGLAIAQKIIEQHHGIITLKSELGMGTTVTIQIPLITAKDTP